MAILEPNSLILNVIALLNFFAPIVDHLDVPIDIKLPLTAVVVHIPDLAKYGTLGPTLQFRKQLSMLCTNRHDSSCLPQLSELQNDV